MYAYVVVAAIAAVGAWQVQNWRYDAMEKDRAQQEAKEQIRKAERVDQAAAAHEKDKVRIETKYRTVTKEIVREVEKPVYRNVCIGPDGVRNINDLIEHDAASESPRAVPEAAATPNRDR